jgi:hypothetical protein
VLEHHAFVEGVLIDDDDTLLIFGDEVALVDLEDAVNGAGRGERGLWGELRR